MAKKNKGLGFDYMIFAEYGERLEELGGDLKEIFTDLLEQTAETIQWDTDDAMAKSNLPRGGKYSQGDTRKAIVKNPRVSWAGSVAEIPVGFDWAKESAAGYLISGTPRMDPNRRLEEIYGKKKYMRNVVKDMQEFLTDEIKDRMEG